MNINLEFRNPEQEIFYWSKARNNCFSGGFNNGKTYISCAKDFTFLSLFPNYRILIYRQKYKSLKETTMQTFFKICPEKFIFRHDETNGLTVLLNKSVVYWMHMDVFDEQALRGLEINSAKGDQTEEIAESIFLVVDSRIGRWDQAEVPEHLIWMLIESYVLTNFKNLHGCHQDDLWNKDEYRNELLLQSKWPRDLYGRPKIHNYHDILVNPDNQFHWVYKRFHNDSYERKVKYFYIERETDVNLGDPDTMEEMQSRDEEWVNKYFRGKWSASSAQIHFIKPESILDTAEIYKSPIVVEKFEKLLAAIKEKGMIFRVLDHGEASPTCCLWFAAIFNVHICFMEYYVPAELISVHRQNIYDLTEEFKQGLHEECTDYADPEIFKLKSQKNGSFWSTADEYMDTDDLMEGIPTISWMAADNNELATRNRINEQLKLNARNKHPLSEEIGAPSVYFIKRSIYYPNGCHNVIIQTQSQRRELVGSDNGKAIYSDERDKKVTDHAYDPFRYYTAMHNKSIKEKPRKAPKMSFRNYNNIRANRPGFIAGILN